MNGVRFPPWRQSERGFRLSALASLIVKREIRMFNLSQSKAPVGTPFFLLSLSLCSQSSSAVSGVSDVLAKLLSHWSPTPGMPTERRKQKATSQRKYVTKSLNTAYYSKAFQQDNHNYMQYAISIVYNQIMWTCDPFSLVTKISIRAVNITPSFGLVYYRKNNVLKKCTQIIHVCWPAAL